jgi:2-dehydropantoate 2-reductase
MDGAVSARIAALDAFMQNAGFNARLSPVIAREMWEKWILLAGLGGVNCLMRGSIGEVEAASGGTAFVESLLNEIIAVVKAVGVPPSPEFITFAHVTLTAKDSQMTSSMYRDLLKGAPIEADQIIGDLLARGSQAGIATPMIAAVYANLSVYQAGLRRGP